MGNEWISSKKGLNRYLIFANGQYREIVEAKNKEEALTRAIRLGYTGTIEVLRMKRYENIGATSVRVRPKTWEQYYPEKLLKM